MVKLKNKFQFIYKPFVYELKNTILNERIYEKLGEYIKYISNSKKTKIINEQVRHLAVNNNRISWLNNKYLLMYFKFTNKLFKYIKLFIKNNMIELIKNGGKKNKYLVITPIKLYLLLKFHETLKPTLPNIRDIKDESHMELLDMVIESMINKTAYIKVFVLINFLKLYGLNYNPDKILFYYELKPSIHSLNLSSIVKTDVNYTENFTHIINIINDENCRNRKAYLININPFYNLDEIETFIESFNYKYCTKDIKSYKIRNILGVTKHAPTLTNNNSGQNIRESQVTRYFKLTQTKYNSNTRKNLKRKTKQMPHIEHIPMQTFNGQINTGNNSYIKYFKPRSEEHRINTTPTLGEEQHKKSESESESESSYGDYGFIDLLLMEKMKIK
jgi:hypothetical protein